MCMAADIPILSFRFGIHLLSYTCFLYELLTQIIYSDIFACTTCFLGLIGRLTLIDIFFRSFLFVYYTIKY